MVYDYLGLPNQKKSKRQPTRNDGFLNMNSDYLGLGSFAANRRKDTHALVKGAVNEGRRFRNDVKEIKKEAGEFKKDFGGGGWIGDYIRRKRAKR